MLQNIAIIYLGRWIKWRMRRRRLPHHFLPRIRIWRRLCPPWPSRSAVRTWTAEGSPGSAAIAEKPAQQPMQDGKQMKQQQQQQQQGNVLNWTGFSNHHNV